jgi:ppGpp synthetase/RelA/SpoT-type nucleotidyltranferase
MTPDERREQYRLQRARYERLASRVAETMSTVLRREAIQHFVSFRSKHPDDIAEKVVRKIKEGKTAYRDARDLNEAMTDLAGVRIVVYDPGDEPRAAELVRRNFQVRSGPPEENDFERPRMELRNDGTEYCASHLTVMAPPEDPLTDGACCEVQVCNIVAHVFNEFDHDIGYKHKVAEPRQKTMNALKKVRAKTRELEAAVVELLMHHKHDAQAQQVNLNDADDLKRGLEGFFSRTLTGNFEFLFTIAQAFINPLTVRGLGPSTIEKRGRGALERLGFPHQEDATVFVAACVSGRLAEASELLESWVKENPGDTTGEAVDAVRKMVAESVP